MSSFYNLSSTLVDELRMQGYIVERREIKRCHDPECGHYNHDGSVTNFMVDPDIIGIRTIARNTTLAGIMELWPLMGKKWILVVRYMDGTAVGKINRTPTIHLIRSVFEWEIGDIPRFVRECRYWSGSWHLTG